MELLVQATTIMILGMAVTFSFLGVVIAGVNLAARIIHHFDGAPQEEGLDTPPPAAPDRRKVVAAIAAALLHKPPDKA